MHTNLCADQSKTLMKKRRSRVLVAVGIPLLLLAIPWYPHAVNMSQDVAVTADTPPISQNADGSVFARGGQSGAMAFAVPRQSVQTKDAPAVYQYVGSGLAENSWYFTDPEGVPGFGPLDPDDAQRLLTLIDHRLGR